MHLPVGPRVAHAVRQSQPAGVTALLLLLLDSPKGSKRGIPGLVRRHPCGDVFLRLQLDVVLELFI
jgi:hypothetical protein